MKLCCCCCLGGIPFIKHGETRHTRDTQDIGDTGGHRNTRGHRGHRGHKGTQGGIGGHRVHKGTQGTQGIQGSQGTQGDTGGHRGTQGAQGIQNRIHIWLAANKLTLNTTKTEFLLIGSRKRLSTLERNPIIEINQFPIKQVSTSKSLGVLINRNLFLGKSY